MRILKICLGLIIIILGIVVFNKYQNDELSLEKESFMDTIFANDSTVELVFNDYAFEDNVSKFSKSSNYTKLATVDEKFSIYKNNNIVYGVDEARNQKLFQVETTNLVDELCNVTNFKNVLGKDGVRFTFVDDRGERTMYFYDDAEKNTMVLLADELNIKEMYLGNEYKSLITEDKAGLVNSIITKDESGIVKKAVINGNTEKDAFAVKANVDEETFVLTKVNKHGYTQTSPYIFNDYELQPVFMEVKENDRKNKDDEENNENLESLETLENEEVVLKEVYPLINPRSGTKDYVSNDGTLFVYDDSLTVSEDAESNIVNIGTTEVKDDGSKIFTTTESYDIAQGVNSNFTSVTGYVDENYNDGFTYVYYKINDDYYAVKNVERNNYSFVNAEGVEVTSFKFYNEPKAYGEYIFVQDDKEAYFLNGNLEKVTSYPTLKGYYDFTAYENAFILTSSLEDGKAFVTNNSGELIFESNVDSITTTYVHDKNDDSIIKDSEVVYTVTPNVYNSNFNYNGVYAQVTGLENIVAEEEINHTLKKYVIEAVDKYNKNTDSQTALLNNYFVYQEATIQNEILKIKQTETLKNNKETIKTDTNYYYFDMATGTELFVKDIFTEGYETRVIEELNKIANNENTKLAVNIDEIGKFYVLGDLYVTYELGEVTGTFNGESVESAYTIQLPLESVTDVINYKSNTYKAFSKNLDAFSGIVPTQTSGLAVVSTLEDGENSKFIISNVLYPQFVSTGEDVYKTINDYYLGKYESEDFSVINNSWSVFKNEYLSDKFLQVRIERMNSSANNNVYYINDLWNVETGEKLDLYSLFKLEPEETEEFLDEIIYNKAKTFYDAKEYDENSGERYGLLEIYKNYTTETGERNTEVGKRAIDAIDFSNDWYLTTDGLVLVFQEYEHDGNESQFKLFIPYGEISENLNDEIVESIKINKK